MDWARWVVEEWTCGVWPDCVAAVKGTEAGSVILLTGGQKITLQTPVETALDDIQRARERAWKPDPKDFVITHEGGHVIVGGPESKDKVMGGAVRKRTQKRDATKPKPRKKRGSSR